MNNILSYKNRCYKMYIGENESAVGCTNIENSDYLFIYLRKILMQSLLVSIIFCILNDLFVRHFYMDMFLKLNF